MVRIWPEWCVSSSAAAAIMNIHVRSVHVNLLELQLLVMFVLHAISQLKDTVATKDDIIGLQNGSRELTTLMHVNDQNAKGTLHACQ